MVKASLGGMVFLGSGGGGGGYACSLPTSIF